MTRARAFFRAAQAHHAAGRVQEAAQACQQAVAADPRHTGSLHLLATIALAGGQQDMAIGLMRQALAVDPALAAVHADLALVLHNRNEIAAAVGHYERAISLKFKAPEIFHNLGVALASQGKLADAVVQYERALAKKPDFVAALFNLGNALRAQGKIVEAIARFRQVLGLQSDHTDARCNLGEALMALGELDEAATAFRETLSLRPDMAAAHNNFAAVLQRQKQFEDAARHARQALALQPIFPQAAHNLGLALQAQGEIAAAATAYRQAIAQAPDFANAHADLGAALFALSDLDAAAVSLTRALVLDPGNIQAMNNLGSVRLDQGQPEEAAALYRKALAQDPNYLDALSNLTFAANFMIAYDTEAQQRLRRDWNAAVKRLLPTSPAVSVKKRGDRLRIGYVSAHFRHQAAAYALAPGILHHDRSRFEVVCYSDTRDNDEVTTALRAATTQWRDTRSLSDAALAALIRSDGIDILIDCTGHMGGARHLVFARKPAPIQVTAWGEPTGTGLTEMDYLLADPVLVPAAERALFAEAIADLPCFLGYWAPDALPEAGPLPAANMGHVTFGSFNRAAKITDATLALWSRVMGAVPSARLVLKDRVWSHAANRARLGERLAAHGISPERVELIGGTTRADHFTAYQRIDVALDPLPHGGGMTTLEALWMGVPVLTKRGVTPSSRLAAAVLSAVDLGDWIATDDAHYVAKAVAAAGDLSRLATLRQGLRAHIAGSPVAPAAYARALEDMLLKIAR